MVQRQHAQTCLCISILGLPSNRSETLAVKEQSLYFPCGDGEIISILGQCDGKKDCVSGTDEENCNNSSKSMTYASKTVCFSAAVTVKYSHSSNSVMVEETMFQER